MSNQELERPDRAGLSWSGVRRALLAPQPQKKAEHFIVTSLKVGTGRAVAGATKTIGTYAMVKGFEKLPGRRQRPRVRGKPDIILLGMLPHRHYSAEASDRRFFWKEIRP